MKYRIDAKYCWFNKGTQLVLMYFINNIPFTFDDTPESYLYDLDIIELADKEKRYDIELLYKLSNYLIMEECHPLLLEIELENPENMPSDI